MRFIALIVLLAAAACNPPQAAAPAITPPPPAPRACFNICSSSIECSGIIQRCPFCNFGSCKATRPELRDCLLACAPDVEPRPVWCDFGGCGDVLRAAAAAPAQ